MTRAILLAVCLLAGIFSGFAQIPGSDPNAPIDITGADGRQIHLTISDDYPYLPVPVYLHYEAGQRGFLMLHFRPGITELRVKRTGDEDFQHVQHTYLMEYGVTIGAEAKVEISEGEIIEFVLTGFKDVTLTTEEVDPEPGTMADFPLPWDGDTLVLPEDATDWYWSFTPEDESYAEIDTDISLPGGYVEIMMDATGFGSFMIEGYLTLRCQTYDRMEYILHVHRPAGGREERFEMKLGAPQKFDYFYEGEDLASGETHATPPFAGTYHYRIASGSAESQRLTLETLDKPRDERTRVNLYKEDNPYDTVARGLDLEYEVEPDTEYIIVYTVFDNRHSLSFKATLSDESGVNPIHTQEADPSAYDLSGRPVDADKHSGIVVKDGKLTIRK